MWWLMSLLISNWIYGFVLGCESEFISVDNMHSWWRNRKKVHTNRLQGINRQLRFNVAVVIPKHTPPVMSMSCLCKWWCHLKEKGSELAKRRLSRSQSISIEARQVHFQTQSPELSSLSYRSLLLRAPARAQSQNNYKIIFKEVAVFHKDISPAELISLPRCNWGVT